MESIVILENSDICLGNKNYINHKYKIYRHFDNKTNWFHNGERDGIVGFRP